MWVLLPLKHLSAAKHRLGGFLSASERGALVRAMSDDLLGMLTLQPGIERIVICSKDRRAGQLAADWGVEHLAESELGAPGSTLEMNDAVNAAASHLAAGSDIDLACIAGDVPLLSAEELAEFLRTHLRAPRPSVTLAPDRWRQGTNLIAWQPASGFSVAFGPGSMERHRALAQHIGATFTLCEAHGSGLDIDEPRDLRALAGELTDTLAPQTLNYLKESGLLMRLLADEKKEGVRAPL